MPIQYRQLKSRILEPTIGLEPMNLALTKGVLCQLSYVGMSPKLHIVLFQLP